MDITVLVLTGVLGATATWGYLSRRAIRDSQVVWSPVSISQLELHHKLTIAMADRVHLDPSCRELLKHQVNILKAVGVVGGKEEAIDVTPPSSLELQAHGPRADGGPPLVPRQGFKRCDLDAFNRARGYRIAGDDEEDEIDDDE